MFQAPFVRPPRMAVWLVDLFTPNKQSESIPGDLLEEFSELASKSGVASARRWYWRQSVKTVAHLIATGFLVAPWLTARTFSATPAIISNPRVIWSLDINLSRKPLYLDGHGFPHQSHRLIPPPWRWLSLCVPVLRQ